MQLGTREVETYTPPDWTYNKILVVEKAGLWPVLEAAGSPDWFDMAVITSEGFGVEACREAARPHAARRRSDLLSPRRRPLRIQHRPHVLGEETVRMPGHHVEVTDLGLTVDAAISSSMEPEPYKRDRALPARIIPHLSPAALEWFTGPETDWDDYGKPKKWACQRVELNAFTSPGLIAYIEDGLRAQRRRGEGRPACRCHRGPGACRSPRAARRARRANRR